MRVLLACLLASLGAHASIRVVDVTGAASASVVLPTEVTIIQSLVGSDCGGTKTEVCNNCLENFDAPCATRYASLEKFFFINFRSTSSGTLSVVRSYDDAAIAMNGSSTIVKANVEHSVKLKWSDIDSALFSSSIQTGIIKLKVDSAYVSIRVTQVRKIGATSDCTTNVSGICGFRTSAHKKTAYMDLDISTDYPNNSLGDLDLAGVRVLIKPISSKDISKCPMNDSQTACGIEFSAQDVYADIDVESDFSFDDKIPGLESGKHYCMSVVNRDIAGNLGLKVSLSGTTDRKCTSVTF